MTRLFTFKGFCRPDPNRSLSIDEVKALYSAEYLELATADVRGPEDVGDKMCFWFELAIGSKDWLMRRQGCKVNAEVIRERSHLAEVQPTEQRSLL